MPKRRYWAPQELLWDQEEDPAETAADLQRINEQARAESARDALNVLNGPQRDQFQPGFARAPGNTVYMGGGLPDAVREQQRRQNLLLGSAQALAMLSGKTEFRGTNALPSTVNNIGPGDQLPGTQGAPGAAEMLMRRQMKQGRIAPPVPEVIDESYHDRFQNQQGEDNPYDKAREEEWAKYRKRKSDEYDADRDAAVNQPASGYARDDSGRVATLASDEMDEEERRRLEMERNWRRNMQWRLGQPAPYR